MKDKKYKISIWGSRGSFIQTTLDKVRYGLETCCISIETENEFFVIDCGSGIRSFDEYIYENKLTYKKINILLTHYHHDHIWGLGYVKFIFDKHVDIKIFGLGDVQSTLFNYFSPPYFPVHMFSLSDNKTNSISVGETLKFSDINIDTVLLQHPQMCVGYKFILGDKTLCIITDYEYKIDTKKREVEKFMQDCDYLIIDAFGNEDDYIENWGHSSIDDVLYLGEKVKAKQILLFHHHVTYTDDFLDSIQENINKKYDNVNFAKDNMFFEI